MVICLGPPARPGYPLAKARARLSLRFLLAACGGPGAAVSSVTGALTTVTAMTGAATAVTAVTSVTISVIAVTDATTAVTAVTSAMTKAASWPLRSHDIDVVVPAAVSSQASPRRPAVQGPCLP